MKSIFKATAILSGSSVISILLGLVSAKVLAIFLQPAGYGYYGLLQSFVGLMALVAGMGMATGLVRLGAALASRNDQAALANLRGGAWILFGVLACVTIAILLIFRTNLSVWALGTPDEGRTIILMGIALLFTVASNVQIGILNAHHQVGALAKYGVVNTLLSSLITIGCVLVWRVNGVVPAVIAGGGVTWAASFYYFRKVIGPVKARASWEDASKSAWELFRFGAPFTASSLVGTGVQLSLPILVMHLLNTESVGYYKAAVAISVGYLGFLVTAMGQDYYPRASAVADKPDALVTLINEQHRLVMLLAIPVILGMLALVPILIPLVYSHKFGPAIDILEWQLIGDIFKFSSWTMSFAILARCRTHVYFLTECIGGVATLLMTYLAVRWFGLLGLGIGFLASYIVYYFATWMIIRREIPLVWTSTNKRMIFGAVVAAFVIRILPSTRFAAWRSPISLILAFAAGVPSLYMIWREFTSETGAEIGHPFRNETSTEVPAP